METHVEGFRYRLLPKSLLSNFCFTITAIILTTQFQDHVVFAGNIAEIKLWLTCVGIGPTTSWKLHSSALPPDLQGQLMISAALNIMLKSWQEECIESGKYLCQWNQHTCKIDNMRTAMQKLCCKYKCVLWTKQKYDRRHLKILQYVNYFKVLL